MCGLGDCPLSLAATEMYKWGTRNRGINWRGDTPPGEGGGGSALFNCSYDDGRRQSITIKCRIRKRNTLAIIYCYKYIVFMDNLVNSLKNSKIVLTKLLK